MELELLQPALQGGNTLGDRNIFPQDICGAAWFDDVTVSQVPKVKMSTDHPGSIFRRGAQHHQAVSLPFERQRGPRPHGREGTGGDADTQR